MIGSGDYISREAALAYIKENQCKRCSDIGLCGKCAVLTAAKLFESIPTADVRPVVNTCETCGYKTDQIRVKPYDGACCYWKLHSIKNEEWCCHWKQREES